MSRLGRRDLQAEIDKHFLGTPAARAGAALRLGDEALELFRATLPASVPRAEARAIMRRNAHPGRRRSPVMRRLNG
ncbi:MAG: hypothetical protein U0802_16790 [Candidatus Binatia bacterium]